MHPNPPVGITVRGSPVRGLRGGMAALGLALLAGCATPLQIAPGSARGEVVGRLGPPVAEYVLPSPPADPAALQVDASGRAVRRLEYGGGSFGRFTWMLDFDAADRLLASAQVRTEARFNAVRAGIGQDELLRTLGRPSNVRGLSFQKQNVWSWRYDSPFCQWFQVGVGYDGRVVDTSYGPDPLCDDDGPGLSLMRGPGRWR